MQDGERVALDRLSRIQAPAELRAALLAMLATPGSQRERRAWRDEIRGLSSAEALRAEVEKLSPALRLPWFEELLNRAALTSVLDRQMLVESARRVMAADGQVRPVDRLQWLVMRHKLKEPLHEPADAKPAHDSYTDMKELTLHLLRQVAAFTAFLSRLVPGNNSGTVWYMSAMEPWLTGIALPPCQSPDADALAHALADIQGLPWMLKPVIVRAWLDAAVVYSKHGRLSDESADALRLSAVLLDSPMPPELARHYIEPTSPDA